MQRVRSSAVEVGGSTVGEIGAGLLVLAGFNTDDNERSLSKVANKVVNLRIFPNCEGGGHFERSLIEFGGEVLVVSQFTLYANIRKGRRPSFVDSAPGGVASGLYAQFCSIITAQGVKVSKGLFGADMMVTLSNWGPATFNLDSDHL